MMSLPWTKRQHDKVSRTVPGRPRVQEIRRRMGGKAREIYKPVKGKRYRGQYGKTPIMKDDRRGETNSGVYPVAKRERVPDFKNLTHIVTPFVASFFEPRWPIQHALHELIVAMPDHRGAWVAVDTNCPPIVVKR